MLRTKTGIVLFGVPVAGDEGVSVAGMDLPTFSTSAAPREADTAQLRAAEQIGFFPYSDAADRDSVKGHAA